MFVIPPLICQGMLALRQGRPAEALATACRVQKVVPQALILVADARRLEGEALNALGRSEEAEAILRQAKADAGA